MTNDLIRQQAIQDVQAAITPLAIYLKEHRGDVYDWALEVKHQSDCRLTGRERTAYICALIQEGKKGEDSDD